METTIASLMNMNAVNKKAVEAAFHDKLQNSVSNKLSVATSVFIDVLGASQDEHGCLLSAGYSFCPATDSCVREWETPCPSSNSITVGDKTTAIIA
jgi:hypothetical protein